MALEACVLRIVIPTTDPRVAIRSGSEGGSEQEGRNIPPEGVQDTRRMEDGGEGGEGGGATPPTVVMFPPVAQDFSRGSLFLLLDRLPYIPKRIPSHP